MKFVRVIPKYDHLWAVKSSHEEVDELTLPSWLRIYAIRLEPNVYVITGGAIKLSRTMQERKHTALELKKLNRCKAYLKSNGVFDQDSFVELTNEE